MNMKKVNPAVAVCLAFALSSIGCAGSTSKMNNGGQNGGSVALNGDYAFTFSGITGGPGYSEPFAAVGRFTANGAGTFTNGAADANASTGSNTATMNAAAYTVSDKSSGRGSMNLSLVAGGTPRNLNFAFYVVNAGKLFAMVSDSVAGSTPLLNG